VGEERNHDIEVEYIESGYDNPNDDYAIVKYGEEQILINRGEIKSITK